MTIRPATHFRLGTAVLLTVALQCVAFAVPAVAQECDFPFTPTSELGRVNGTANINGNPASTGDLVVAFDSDGNVAGTAEVNTAVGGTPYFTIPIYGDDPATLETDEGIDSGENFTLALCRDGSVSEALGPFSGWQDTGGAPIPAYSDQNTVYNFPLATLSDPPTASDDAASVDEDASTTIDVLANDTDADGTLDPTSVTVAAAPTSGTATPNPDGTITYTPEADFSGADSFTYTVEDNDGNASNEATVDVTVNAVEDAPVAVDDVYNTNEDQVLTVDAGAGVLANDTDADGDDLTATLVAAPAEGILTLNADGSFTYTPAPGFSGNETFTYAAGDGTTSAQATAFINVGGVNDAPVAVDDAETTDEDVPVSVDVLANDTDPDGDALQITAVSDVVGGTAEIESGQVLFTPTADSSGEGSFVYTVSDGNGGTAQGTATITINPVNDAPVFTSEPVTETQLGQPYTYTAEADDVEGDALTFAAATIPGFLTLTDNGDGTATLAGTPPAVGTYPVEIAVSDGNGGMATQSFDLEVIDNLPPTVSDDATTIPEDSSVTINVLANDTDADGTLDPTSVTVIEPAANGTAAAREDGTIAYIPNADFFGTDMFTYTVSDDDAAVSDTATVTVTVLPVNDAPVAVDDDVTVEPDPSGATSVILIPVLVNDIDPDGDALTVVSTSAPDRVRIQEDGNLVYTFQSAASGTDTFTYTVSDGVATDEATVSVTVIGDPTTPPTEPPANRAPVAADDEVSTDLATPVIVDVLANDADPDGDELSITGVGTPSNGTAALADDGASIVYTPADGFTGEDSFTYTVTDGAATAQATVTVTVGTVVTPPPAPAPPTAPAGPITIGDDPDETITITWEPVDGAEGDTLFYVWQLAIDVPGKQSAPGKSSTYEVIYESEPTTETSITIPESAIEAALDAAGVPAGTTVELAHRVVVSNGEAVAASEWSEITITRVTTTAVDDPTTPQSFVLHGNYPNPFNPSTTVRFELSSPAQVHVEVYDLRGRQVWASPVRSLPSGAGHEVRIEGGGLGSGTYLYRVVASTASGTEARTGRMTLVK